MKKQIKNAIAQGRIDFAANVTKCPYELEELQSAWNKGWKEAEAEHVATHHVNAEGEIVADATVVPATEEVTEPLSVIDEAIDGGTLNGTEVVIKEGVAPWIPPVRQEGQDDVAFAQAVADSLTAWQKSTKGAKKSTSERAKPSGKLNAEEAVKVMARLAAGEKQSVIARDYGCHPSTISDIKAGRLYGKATGVTLKVKEAVVAPQATEEQVNAALEQAAATDEQVAENSADVQSFE